MKFLYFNFSAILASMVGVLFGAAVPNHHQVGHYHSYHLPMYTFIVSLVKYYFEAFAIRKQS